MAFFIKRPLFLLIVLLLSFCQCDVINSTLGKHKNYAMLSFSTMGVVNYDYKMPDRVKELDMELREISGLDFNEANNSLLAINDEKGFVYELSIDDFDIISKNEFWNTGDYEGVEFDGKYIWVLKSNGKLYQFDPVNKETVEYETKLSSDNDVEGLCYDPQKQLFYLACKGITLNKKDKVRTKAIYSFNIKDKKLEKEPLIKIHPNKIKKFINEVAKEEVDGNYLDRVEVFSPSAVAMSNNRDLYVLSARGSMLLVIGFNSEIKEITFLNPKYLPQPEGICFDDDGNLYLSTEGKKNKGKLLYYRKIQK